MKSILQTILIISLPILLAAQDRHSDSLALVEIYSDMGGDQWSVNDGWLTSAPLEDWNGITTDGDRVIKLRLFNIGINGIFSESIYNLTALTSLDLYNGTLVGELSEDIYQLTELKTLALNNLGLTGTIPDLSTFTLLDNIRLGGNEFVGTLPDIPATSSLVRFSSNQLVGTIPESWSNNQLTVLSLDFNQLNGPLDILSTLTNIRGLDIDGNAWDQGPLPHWLDDLPSLVNFSGSDANFIGEIPEYDFSNSPNFNQIIINFNDLTGDISRLTQGVTNPLWLDAKDNDFSGELPIDNFQTVSRFDLSNNGYTTLADPDAPLVSQISLRGNAFKISTLLPHLNEFPIDSMNQLYFNGQKTYFEELDTTYHTAQIVTLDAGDSYEGILYQWVKNNQEIEGANSQTLEVDATEISNLIGRFDCIMTHPDLTDKQGNRVEFHRGLIEIRTDFTSSNNDVLQEIIQIYPNPTSDYLHMDRRNTSEIIQYQLISSQGAVLFEGQLKNSTTIDVNSLMTGHYYLQLQDENNKYLHRIIKL